MQGTDLIPHHEIDKRRRRGRVGTPASLFSKLELHHLHYETEGHERPDDLAAYCRDCHKNAHTDRCGDFWVDPEEMHNYWATYDQDKR
jgi:hypothetical protein